MKAPGAAPPARGKAITGHGNRRAPAGYGGAAAGLERRRCRLRFHRVQVLRSVPHPGQGFTQGVIVADGTVWESTGGYGQSRLLRYRLGADQPDAAARLAPELFGEGICLADGGIWQLTWRERVALRWHPDTLELLETIRYNREGWGICHAGEHVFTSDGSSELVRRDPATLAPAGLVRVRCQGRRVGGLNDLAWSAGRIWANLLGTSHLAGIDPGTGEVADLVDAHAVRERHRGDPEAVLNGIAALPGADEFLLTGKRYRRIYHVRLAGRRRRSWPAALTP